MRIAILAWGSLLWDPRELRTSGDAWSEDGPRLPIEFARISQGGRLTLVTHPGAALQPTAWALSQYDELPLAVSNLAEREGTGKGNIGALTHEERTRDDVEERIALWLRTHTNLDAVI